VKTIKEGLQAATAINATVERFNHHFGSGEMLEGLLSKDYVEVVNNHVQLTLAGARALLDFEGLDYRTGKRLEPNRYAFSRD
jgi:hypothetical protein